MDKNIDTVTTLNFCFPCMKPLAVFRIKRHHLSRLMGKPTICRGENKGADQLRRNCEADQRLCFRYSDSTIPRLLNPKFQTSSSFLACTSRFVSDLFGNHMLVFPRGGSFIAMVTFMYSVLASRLSFIACFLVVR